MLAVCSFREQQVQALTSCTAAPSSVQYKQKMDRQRTALWRPDLSLDSSLAANDFLA